MINNFKEDQILDIKSRKKGGCLINLSLNLNGEKS